MFPWSAEAWASCKRMRGVISGDWTGIKGFLLVMPLLLANKPDVGG